MQELVAEDLGLAEDGASTNDKTSPWLRKLWGNWGNSASGERDRSPVAVLEEHVHIGAAEPVDALLRVAHRAHVGEAGCARAAITATCSLSVSWNSSTMMTLNRSR